MTPSQLLILHATLSSAIGSAIERDAATEDALVGQWVDVYEGLKGCIFQGLGGMSTVDSTTGILSSYLFSCSQVRGALLLDPKLTTVLRGIYTEPAKEPLRGAFENLIRDIAASGSPFDAVALSFLQSFSKSSSAVFEKSLSLQKLLKDVSR